MRIGIDARFYGPVGKGLGRYTQEVVDNVIKIANAGQAAEDAASFDFIVFLGCDNYDEFVCEYPNVHKVLLDIPWYSWKEQWQLPWRLRRERLDLIHFPHFNVPLFTPCPFVVTIHDLILTHFPTHRATTLNPWLYRLKNLAYRLVIKVAVSRSRKIITVSEFTKKDLLAQFSLAPEKVAVTYEGVANLARGRDSLFVAKLDDQETLEQYHISGHFLLYVGNAYPHKNLEALLEVFSSIWKKQPDWRLVLIGRSDYFYERLKAKARALNIWQEGNTNSPVVFPGYVSDAQLEIMYRAAAAYIFPSLYEGFGLPPLEAMARSCPVVSSDRSSMPEILGDAAAYFNPEDKDAMEAQIMAVISDEQRRQELIARGQERIKRYSWWECARETWEIYQAVLRGGKDK